MLQHCSIAEFELLYSNILDRHHQALWFMYLITLYLFYLCRNLSDVLWEAISNRQILSLYQGLGTKNLQSFFSQFVYFYGYSYFKRLYLEKSGYKSIGTRANLLIAAAAGAVTAITTQVRQHYLFFFIYKRDLQFQFYACI